MARTVRRFSYDYAEDNPELQENLQNGLQDNVYEYADYDIPSQDSPEIPAEDYENDKPANTASTAGVWKKIAKIVLIIFAFVALFFASMWTTRFMLDRNHQVDDFGNDAPAYSDNGNDEEFGIVIDSDDKPENVTIVEDTENEELAEKPLSENQKPASSTSSDNKKEESSKPSTSDNKNANSSADSSGNTSHSSSDSKENTTDKPVSDNTSDDTKPEPSTPAPKPSAPSAVPVPSAPTLIPSTPAF